MATDKTKIEYEKIAKHFYIRLERKCIKLTAKNISDELLACAPEYRPAYWRRLRGALAHHQRTLGYDDAATRILALHNPVTAKGSTLSVKQKQTRVKSIAAEDETGLIDYFNVRNDKCMVAAIKLFKLTGIRPTELAGVTVDSNRLTVIGAKKSHHGTRGADRVLQLDGITALTLYMLVTLAQKVNVGCLQDKLRAAGKNLWPKRKHLPTFYSWRHQMGSELKASGMGRLQIAYLMGHQATASIDRYGNRKSAKGGRLPSCPADADLSHIRVTHSVRPTDNKNYIQPSTPILVVEPNEGSNAKDKSTGMAAYIKRNKQKDDGLSR